MKISRSKGTCTILFEDNDEFAGKKLYMEGEMISKGFQFTPQTLQWMTYDAEGFFELELIDESAKSGLIPYIIDEAKKQDISLEIW
jgi:3,4-dihydroxy-2-butanone 4-phosphate synthase